MARSGASALGVRVVVSVFAAVLVCLPLSAVCGSPEICSTSTVLSMARPATSVPMPTVSAESAILVEWQTGTILYEQNAFKRMHPASVTKMMTALLALENGRLDAVVTVSPEAADQPGSTMHLVAGDGFTLENLLYGLMLNSGNDAAWAIAEEIGGTAEEFFDMMNRRAQEIGAINTRYQNPHGLTDPNHYTTAFDLSLIARTCLRHPYFRRLCATKEKDVPDAGETAMLELQNTNQLLWSYLGADGVKTGTTESAGMCLVASATREETRLLVIVLNSQDRWSDAASLLDYGFSNFLVMRAAKAGDELAQVPARGATVAKVPLVCASDLLGCMSKDSTAAAQIEIEAPQFLDAPCPTGTVAGRATLMQEGVVIGRTDLLVPEWVNKRSPGGDLVRSLVSVTRLLSNYGVY